MTAGRKDTEAISRETIGRRVRGSGSQRGTSQNARIAARARSSLRYRTIFEIARFHNVLAFEAYVGYGMGKGAHPHAVNFSKAHQDIKVVNPPGRVLYRTAFNAMDVVGLRVHPHLAPEQVFLFTPGIQ